MIRSILEFFEKPSPEAEAVDPEERVRIAACALLVEIASCDEDFSEEEQDAIVTILKQRYELTEEQSTELITAAREEIDSSVDLWRFANRINEYYSRDEKKKIIELVWQVVYVDGKLDRHEDHLVHRMARILNLTHPELIDAKVRVLRKAENE